MADELLDPVPVDTERATVRVVRPPDLADA
jgi:hypothetical protein